MTAGAAPDGGPRTHRFAREAMACECEIIIAGDDAVYARQAADAAFAELEQVEGQLSRYIPASDIAQLNALPPGQAMLLGPFAMECLRIAREVYRATGGAFDAAVGALVDLQLGRARGGAAQPSAPVTAEQVAVALRESGMDKLGELEGGRAVGRLTAGVTVDLGAIGKGYAVDQMVGVLRQWGIGSALVHMGQSSVFAIAQGKEHGWRVGVRRPGVARVVENADDSQSARGAAADSLLGHITLRELGLGGSGVSIHGPHIIDPRTGAPATHNAGAWAIAPTAALADAYSTAFMVLTLDEVAQVCAATGVKGMVLTCEGALHCFPPGVMAGTGDAESV